MITDLTSITNFLCMAVSLWFAIYLLARSSADPFTFRAAVGLLALAFYYNNAFADMVKNNSNSSPEHSLATLIALIAAHSLTHNLLPLPRRKKLYWTESGTILIGVVAIVLLYMAPLPGSCDPRFTCPASLAYPWWVINLIKAVFFFAILYNLWHIRKNVARFLNVAFYEALVLACCTMAYSLVGTILSLPLPRFIPNLIMLATLALLQYSVAREETIVTQRSYTYDLPITLLTVIVIVSLYILSALQIGLSTMNILLLAVMAIFTHSAYDFVREFIDRMVRIQEGRMRHELRQLARDSSSSDVLPRFLERGLAILCHKLCAPNGLIALRQGDQYQVVASLHCLPVGWQFPAEEIPPESNSGLEIALMGYKLWLVPAYLGSEIAVIVGVGSRMDQSLFSEEDYYWLEDIAEEIGFMVSVHWKCKSLERGTLAEQAPEAGYGLLESIDDLATGELLTKLAYKPDLELVKYVEESLRILYDYSKLGKSPLASMFGIQAQDHIECGKLVQRKLVEIIEKLRPVGIQPKEPLPREWYAYTILHDAYVENLQTREIMSKLYISEGTYYRMRRHALRGIARAMLEMGAVG